MPKLEKARPEIRMESEVTEQLSFYISFQDTALTVYAQEKVSVSWLVPTSEVIGD